MANLTRAVLQKMLKCALERNEIRENPLAKRVTPYKIGTHHTWTDAELEQFEAKWPLGTRPRLAYALLFYTGNVAGMSREWPGVTFLRAGSGSFRKRPALSS